MGVRAGGLMVRLARSVAQPGAGPGAGTRGEATVGVFWARLSSGETPPPGVLDAVERGRWAAYRRPVDRQRFLLGVLLTRLVLAELVGGEPGDLSLDRTCPGCGAPHGPVRLQNGAEWQVSVTHSGDWVGLAVAREPVGVDVEPLAAAVGVAEVVAEVLTPAERRDLDLLGAGRRARGMLRYWTRKEAVLKAARVGMSVPFTDLVVNAPDEPASLLSRPVEWGALPPAYLVDLAGTPGHVAALAVLTGVVPVVLEADATGEVEVMLGDVRDR